MIAIMIALEAGLENLGAVVEVEDRFPYEQGLWSETSLRREHRAG